MKQEKESVNVEHVFTVLQKHALLLKVQFRCKKLFELNYQNSPNECLKKLTFAVYTH